MIESNILIYSIKLINITATSVISICNEDPADAVLWWHPPLRYRRMYTVWIMFFSQ